MVRMLSGIRRFMLLAVVPAALAVGCGGGTNSTKTSNTTIQKSKPAAQTGHYHVGERCQHSLAFAYSAQGFTCVNGTLRHKARHTSPSTVHHHTHTTTAAPQGY
jgi:hypothetical protein